MAVRPAPPAPRRRARARRSIGLLNEGPLHAALRRVYAERGDRAEVAVDGFCIDLRRGDLLIEFQTGSFSAIARKLRVLVDRHRVRLVHPVARQRWIVKLPAVAGKPPTRRRSPKRAGLEEIFRELVSFPDLLAHRNFELEVIGVHEEEVRRFDGRQGRRRRGWVVVERRLLEVCDRVVVRRPADLVRLLPGALPARFHTGELAAAIQRPRWLAQKVAYCLRECGVTEVVGKERNALVYAPVVSCDR